jgi:CDP-diacylglycerol---glycerol-3-phosphate 3-phosphatidyltransferase
VVIFWRSTPGASARAHDAVNLPNAITAARIVVAPLIALLPLMQSPGARLSGFVLYIVAAITDYWDGHLARTRNLVTDLGRLLDPLADKLLLVATLIPMFMLQRGALLASPATIGGVDTRDFRFLTPLGAVGLPLWIVIVILGREAFMTAFRQFAARRGTVIAAIGPAKWKTTFQSIWVGAAYAWFFAATLGERQGWMSGAPTHPLMAAYTTLNGVVGALAMVGAVALTVYSLVLYLQRYGSLLRPRR